MINKEFEILAPAGSFQTFKAVIEAGADAVYVGGTQFGARAYADNFTEEELLQAIDYAHIRDKKVYLTVNTLLKNNEIDNDLYDYLLPFYERGLDAVLVQDFGALNYIHNAFPDLPIHTSTQMTVTGIDGVKLLQQYGVTRVVMARETSLPEMKHIHEETGMELEAFVHGALCYCYSGQCLFSSLLGGRSGNRGRCAQPCRLSYSTITSKGQTTLEDSFILSMKDMCGIKYLKELNSSGVYSLKIEGRMKKPEYAAGVVSFYRKYVDNMKEISDKDYESIKALGNRCGFTDKYYHEQNSKDMITYEKPSFAMGDEAVINKLTGIYIDTETKFMISGFCELHEGSNSLFTVQYNNYVFTATGNVIDKAQNKPLIKDDVIRRLSKTGDTSFVFDTLEIIMDDNIFIPNGSLNELRRNALDGLKALILDKNIRSIENTNKLSKDTYVQKINISNEATDSIFSASVETKEQLDIVSKSTLISKVYIDWNRYDLINHDTNTFEKEFLGDLDLLQASDKEAYIIFPAICRKSTSDFINSVKDLFQNDKLSGFVVKNYEELGYCLNNFKDKKIITDHNLYTYNNYAKASFEKLGVSMDTMPLELNSKEIADRRNINTEMIVYGYYPLMTSAQCVHKNSDKCDKCKQITYLKDRYNKRFPVKNHCNECMNVIYNSVPTLLLNSLAKLENNNLSYFRLMFTVENSNETQEILSFFENPSLSVPGDFTNGHYKRGVE